MRRIISKFINTLPNLFYCIFLVVDSTVYLMQKKYIFLYFGTFIAIVSSEKKSCPGNFLKARFVIFRCQKYVKKGQIEMTKKNLP